MGRPTWDEAKEMEAQNRERQDRARRDAAILAVGEAVVREWDDGGGFCPWCIEEEGHEEGCPGPLVEAYIEEHGHLPATPSDSRSTSP